MQVPGSLLSGILSSYVLAQPSERSKILEDSQDLAEVYLQAALEKDSEAPLNPEDEVDFHYTCFVKSGPNGHLYELDGDRSGPAVVGALQPEEDVVCESGLNAIREYIEVRRGEKVGFSLLVLVSC